MRRCSSGCDCEAARMGAATNGGGLHIPTGHASSPYQMLPVQLTEEPGGLSAVPPLTPQVMPGPAPVSRPTRFARAFTIAREYELPPVNNGANVTTGGIVHVPRGQQQPGSNPRPFIFRAPSSLGSWSGDVVPVGTPTC